MHQQGDLANALAMKAFGADSEEVGQAILSAMLLHGLEPKPVEVRWSLSNGASGRCHSPR